MTHRCASPSPRPSKLRANMTRQSTRASRYCEPMCVPVRVASRGVYCMCMARSLLRYRGRRGAKGRPRPSASASLSRSVPATPSSPLAASGSLKSCFAKYPAWLHRQIALGGSDPEGHGVASVIGNRSRRCNASGSCNARRAEGHSRGGSFSVRPVPEYIASVAEQRGKGTWKKERTLRAELA